MRHDIMQLHTFIIYNKAATVCHQVQVIIGRCFVRIKNSPEGLHYVCGQTAAATEMSAHKQAPTQNIYVMMTLGIPDAVNYRLTCDVVKLQLPAMCQVVEMLYYVDHITCGEPTSATVLDCNARIRKFNGLAISQTIVNEHGVGSWDAVAG